MLRKELGVGYEMGKRKRERERNDGENMMRMRGEIIRKIGWKREREREDESELILNMKVR